MIEVQFPDEAGEQTERLRGLVSKAAAAALKAASAGPQAGLTVVLGDDQQLRRLNHQFLGIDTATDVLSFPNGDTDPDSSGPYLGDVVISLERAEAQAAEGGHRLDDELQLLVVHGVLHLLGHDHADEDEKAKMWSIQAQVLETLGCPLRP